MALFKSNWWKENQVRYKKNMMTLLPSQKKLYSSLWTRANLPFLPWSNSMLFQIVCIVHWLLALFLLAIAMKHSMELLPEGYHRQAIQNHYRQDLPKGQDRLHHGLRSITITNHNYINWTLQLFRIIARFLRAIVQKNQSFAILSIHECIQSLKPSKITFHIDENKNKYPIKIKTFLQTVMHYSTWSFFPRKW